jgi:NADH-quinone oxidoreductase subunit K
MGYGMILAGLLFVTGLAGVIARRNAVFMLMSIEIMLNAAGLAFIAAGSRWHSGEGLVMFILMLTVAAAEVSVGLAIVLLLDKRFGTIDMDAASRLKEK